VKVQIFLLITRCMSETIENMHIGAVEEKTNRKSHIGFRLVPISVTLNDCNALPYPTLYSFFLGLAIYKSE